MPRGRPRGIVAPCQFCNMQFKRVEHLRRHERTHTKEKPFACGCGEKFSRQDLLARHVKLSHQSSQIEQPSSGIDANRLMWEATSSNVDTPSTGQNETQSESTDPHCNQEISQEQHMLSTLHSHVSDGMIVGMNEAEYGIESFANTQSFTFDSQCGSGTIDELDFLWDYSSNARGFLPTTFFNTDLSLSDIWNIGRPGGEDDSAIIRSPRTGEHPTLQPSDIRQPGSRFRPLTVLEEAIHRPNQERLPATDLDDCKDSEAATATVPGSVSWVMSHFVYNSIVSSILGQKRAVPPSFAVPSRHTLSRYTDGYFRGFHKHLPFLHPSTLRFEALAPELVLAIAAVGAFYRFEHAKGYELYFAARAIIAERMQTQSPFSTSHLTTTLPSYASFSSARSNVSASGAGSCSSPVSSPPLGTIDQGQLHTIQALIILLAMSSWADAPIVRDSTAISSQLGMLVREAGISIPDAIAEGTEWVEWVTREVRRRTLLVAYILFNLQSMSFDVPPVIMNHEVRLCLPHCGSEWAATTAAEWQELRTMYGHDESGFQEVFQKLLDGQEIHNNGPFSALGNYVLMSGLLQRIFLERHTSGCLPDASSSLRPVVIKTFECALRIWQISWEATQESSLDPSSSKGPLGFNAVAMLRLAYIRLNANLGPYRNLITRDPHRIAGALTNGTIPLFVRNFHLDRAVLQCIHALSVPVHTGISFVAHTQALNWSVQSALSNLDCAFLLNRWLYVLAGVVETTGIKSLRGDERKLVGMVVNLIRESTLAKNLDFSDIDGQCIRRMGAMVFRLWAEIFRGPHVFSVVDSIGASLSTAADMLEAQL
ncbi:hypothetical protein BKA61DRAFT_285143 [Leptodontidium sp. MPI-SDFR-AT-0119]|nr:hypothetical protein BKA61DRAFT_285143 [Leptodontidium sp. MPI-SDFR-AT-0119]